MLFLGANPNYVEAVAAILVVDDDPTVSGVLVKYLENAGFDVAAGADGQEAVALAKATKFDLILLDLMLPKLDGFEVFRKLRQSGSTAPVIMLTAKGEESDRILGLEMGADDYVAKPFSPRELVLRVRSVLRRSSAEAEETRSQTRLSDGDVTLDLVARKAERAGSPLQLTLREFDLLAHLMQHPNQLVSRDDLMTAVWGWDFGDTSTVTVHVRRLRAKVEPDPDNPTRILTVWGKGYRFEPVTDR